MNIHDFLWGGSDKDKYKESFYDIDNKASSSSDYIKEQQKRALEAQKAQEAQQRRALTEPYSPSVSSAGAANHQLPSFDSIIPAQNRVIPVEDIERLRLTCQAMWELLRDKHGLSDDDIEEKIQEIDLRDGVEDSQMTVTMVTCPSCGKQGRSYRRVCLYCATEIPKSEVFSK